MAGLLPPVVIELKATATDLQAKFAAAKGELSALESHSSSTLGKMSSVGKAAFEVLGAAAVGVGIASVKLATDFNSSMTKVQALTGASSSEMGYLRSAVLDLAPTVGIGPKPLADSLYFIESAGFRGAAAVDILTMSSKASAAGLGATKVVADAVTSAMNAYSASHLTAKQATDGLTEAVVQGKVEADQLAPALGRVIGVSASLGIGYDQMLANISALTRTGQSASQAATSLLGVEMQLTKMQDPTTKQAAALKSIGLSAQEVTDKIKSDGLASALQMITDKAGGNTKALVDMFPNVRALRDVLGTAGVQGKAYAEILDKIQHSTDGAGATQKAFNVTQQDFGFQVKQAGAAAETLGVQIGDWLIPKIKDGAVALSDIVGFFEQNTWAAEALGGAVAAVLVPAMGAFVVNKAVNTAKDIGQAWDSLTTGAQRLAQMLGITQAAQDTDSASKAANAAATETQAGAVQTHATAAGEDAAAVQEEAGAEAEYAAALADVNVALAENDAAMAMSVDGMVARSTATVAAGEATHAAALESSALAEAGISAETGTAAAATGITGMGAAADVAAGGVAALALALPGYMIAMSLMGDRTYDFQSKALVAHDSVDRLSGSIKDYVNNLAHGADGTNVLDRALTQVETHLGISGVSYDALTRSQQHMVDLRAHEIATTEGAKAAHSDFEKILENEPQMAEKYIDAATRAGFNTKSWTEELKNNGSFLLWHQKAIFEATATQTQLDGANLQLAQSYQQLQQVEATEPGNLLDIAAAQNQVQGAIEQVVTQTKQHVDATNQQITGTQLAKAEADAETQALYRMAGQFPAMTPFIQAMIANINQTPNSKTTDFKANDQASGVAAGVKGAVESIPTTWTTTINATVAGSAQAAFASLGGLFHAEGGVFTSPHIGVVAEAGPEAIIPLNDRARALDILSVAGIVRPLDGTSQGAAQLGGAGVASVGGPAPSVVSMNFQVNLNISGLSKTGAQAGGEAAEALVEWIQRGGGAARLKQALGIPG